MARIKVEVDHRRDDGLSADLARDRVFDAVNSFLIQENRLQERIDANRSAPPASEGCA